MRWKWRKCVSKSWLDVQELDIKAMQEGKATEQVETQKIYVNSKSIFYLSTERKEETDMELLEEILNQNNLNKAYKKVVANKGVAGVDGITVEEEFDYLKENKDRILKQIRKRKYKPQPVKRVQIPKENGKMRNLGIPTVTDRIIQQAIFQVISPIFEKQFNDNSFGFRPNRSCEQAVIKALEYLNDGYEWIVDIDLEKFFDTVNQDKLITIIGKTITDGYVIQKIAKRYIM